MPPSKPKPSDVASEAKKHYIPRIKKEYGDIWPTYSYLYQSPLYQLNFEPSRSASIAPPQFYVCNGDPVDFTINWANQEGHSIPFVCAANDKRPGGDWETGVVGYEERLCRRSNLSATLSTPGPDSYDSSNYPIPSEGGIFSEHVVVFRGPHDQYKKLESWQSLPVVSIPPTRWPKLNHHGTKYSFSEERDLVKNKIRAALRICAWNNLSSVVIGDWSLGNSYRNPPQELAELWREIFLYDPDLRGRFHYVAFCFEDPSQSTTKYILDDIAKKSKGSSSSSSSKGKSSKSHSSSGSGSSSSAPSDYEIFQHVFDPNEIHRVMSRPDPRCGISMLTS